ncbi:probable amidophosphoribosyltransferase [Cephalotrichum gorgonifer]|uniref:Amidophosphoribosyltransferase n=1 Tax=Cephalotrichum gorgonifer TaxID=2041049 RepID=A0AAE8MSS0_9PEZI|nr:probable amidophosphoribosyltransferase [Cephalotrichum gorgonifer]
MRRKPGYDLATRTTFGRILTPAKQRGQDAAGIAVCQGGRVYQCKGLGLVSAVFNEGRRIVDLPGWCGIGHLRYPTSGGTFASEAQPFFVNSPFGLSMSVNGNLVNSRDLITFLDREARRHVNTDSDSELLLNVFAHALYELGKFRANVEDVFTALREVYTRCHGAYACTAMIAGFGILGFRDENGIRPLCLGSRPSATLEGATDYFMASESIALTQLGFGNIVDILPGQAVFIEKGGAPQFRQIVEAKSYTPDIFEYVYFARPDSHMDGISVYRSRQNMGRMLAKKMRATLSEETLREIDVIIPVPETSNIAAAVLATELNKPFSSAFIKNRYIFRTFILSEQKARVKSVRRKLSPIESEFKGKVVCIVDDSIVRGTTSREIVQMAKEAGATRVLFVSCSPEVTHPHVHGIDLADPAELIAHGRTQKQIADHMDVAEVIFQDLEDLKTACIEAATEENDVKDFEVGVFCGKYQTVVSEGYFEHLNGNKRKNKKAAPAAGKAEVAGATVDGNSGPVNVSGEHEEADKPDGPANREDISMYNFADK